MLIYSLSIYFRSLLQLPLVGSFMLLTVNDVGIFGGVGNGRAKIPLAYVRSILRCSLASTIITLNWIRNIIHKIGDFKRNEPRTNMKPYLFALMSAIFPFLALAYVPHYSQFLSWTTQRMILLEKMYSTSDDNIVNDPQNDTPPELLLSTSDVTAHMAKLRSKYPTSEADYLAAARARNAAKQASSDRTATDADWQQIAADKKQAVGEIDDWDTSVSEAGNADSQILIPMTPSIGPDGEEEEPKLMLF